ncbi:hypothetical protein QYE76_009029 [Lolium multiflorum]|uniref:Reverse transcriptase Ty1/copia-type domain-containing protein n=1 Tax=Lolium multiflorum TaxID=4521 RepID=A0AAD8TSU4_LOLMU|nr:hypothetical protein QYE76_009029 [Lolium multiflorum]
MQDEFDALQRNQTWTLVPRPPHANIITRKWVFKHKPGTIRTVLQLAVSRAWPVHQMDVSNAFLHGQLEEQVFFQQPTGFIDSAHPDHVCLLSRSLYGLKQAPRAWYQRIAAFLHQLGFRSTRSDASLFVYNNGATTAYLLLYVDNIILTASSTDLLRQITERLRAEFALKDLGPLHYFLGIEVVRRTDGFFLHQRKYAHELLDRAGMLNCKPAATLSTRSPSSPPRMYLTLTRPELQYAVQQVCLHMHAPRDPHWAAVKRILRYIRGTMDFGLSLHASTATDIVAYSDADWAGCPTRVAPRLATASTSDLRSSPGRLSDNPRSLAPAPKRSTGLLLTRLPRSLGCGNSSLSSHVLLPKPPWSIATMSPPSTSPPTRSTIAAPSILSWTSTLFGNRWPLDTFEYFMCPPPNNLRIS